MSSDMPELTANKALPWLPNPAHSMSHTISSNHTLLSTVRLPRGALSLRVSGKLSSHTVLAHVCSPLSFDVTLVSQSCCYPDALPFSTALRSFREKFKEPVLPLGSDCRPLLSLVTPQFQNEWTCGWKGEGNQRKTCGLSTVTQGRDVQ